MGLFDMFTGKDARKNAADARNENTRELDAGYNNNLGYQRRGYQDATNRLMPFYNNGMLGQTGFLNMLGLNGRQAQEGAQVAYGGWNPYLAGGMDEATRAVDRRAAATGNFNSGMAALARDRVARQMGSDDLNNYMGYLQGLGNQGFQAGGALANIDMSNAGAMRGIEDAYRSGNIQNQTNYYNARSAADQAGFNNILGLGGMVIDVASMAMGMPPSGKGKKFGQGQGSI